MELISGSELARRIGITPTAVVRARNRGRIAYADPARKLYADPEVRAAFREPRRSVAAPVVAAPPAPANGSDPVSRTWYDRRQRALALQAEHELRLFEGRLIDKAEVVEVWGKKLKTTRDQLLGIPSRLAAEVPAECRVKVAESAMRLIRAALWELSGHPEEARRER